MNKLHDFRGGRNINLNQSLTNMLHSFKMKKLNTGQTNQRNSIECISVFNIIITVLTNFRRSSSLCLVQSSGHIKNKANKERMYIVVTLQISIKVQIKRKIKSQESWEEKTSQIYTVLLGLSSIGKRTSYRWYIKTKRLMKRDLTCWGWYVCCMWM